MRLYADRSRFSIAGIAVGVAALAVAALQFWIGVFAPRPDDAATLAEDAAGIPRAATDAPVGAPHPDAAPAPWGLERLLNVVVVALRGSSRFAVGASALGAAGVTLEIFIYIASLIVLRAVLDRILSITTLGG